MQVNKGNVKKYGKKNRGRNNAKKGKYDGKNLLCLDFNLLKGR